MKINEFFRSAGKIAIALFLAAIGLLFAIWGYSSLSDAWEKHQAKQYEVIKLWPVELKEYLQFNLLAKTKLADGRLFAIVDIEGYPAYLSDPRLQIKNNNATISLLFQDNDGFTLHSKIIKISEFSSIVDSANKKAGLKYEFDEYLSAKTYARIQKMQAQWTLETTLPASTSAQPNAEEKIPDHCAPNLSKAERLKRLGQHGAVRQNGDGNYSVGYRSLSFFTYDGSLLDCR